MTSSTERFSSRVANYVRYRPSYPQAAIELLKTRCSLNKSTVVADMGSGTGILTQQLLADAAQVAGVEPNDAMRAAAETALGGNRRFRSVSGTAEASTLAPDSVDLLVAGQAFHWFDVKRARAEALRVIRPGGWGALLWNERPPYPSAFLTDYDALLRRHAAEYDKVVASRADEAGMREFFGGTMQQGSFPHQQSFDFEGVVGRLMSASYAPEPGHPEYEPMMAGLRAVFQRHERGGTIVFPYQTLVYFARLKPP